LDNRIAGSLDFRVRQDADRDLVDLFKHDSKHQRLSTVLLSAIRLLRCGQQVEQPTPIAFARQGAPERQILW
jgi:hypothetical protein